MSLARALHPSTPIHSPSPFPSRYGVAYFRDSTPSWSTRFALRQKLLPLIRDVYGDGAHQNLASLAGASDQLGRNN